MLNNGFFEWVQYWAEQLIALFESMKAWMDHFFPAEEEETTTTQA